MKQLLFILCVFLVLTITGISFILLILFTGNILIPWQLDLATARMPLFLAFFINVLLLLLFGVQHSGMARGRFKSFAAKFIPADFQRMVYVILSSLLLIAIVIFWQPLPYVIWQIKSEWLQIVIYSFFFLGWFLTFAAATMINGFDLLGFRTLANSLLQKDYQAVPFQTPVLYRIVRHPLYLGFIIAFWATPVMTVSHLLFSAGMTAYILAGIYFEEKDLIDKFGQPYREYKNSTPKLLPLLQRNS